MISFCRAFTNGIVRFINLLWNNHDPDGDILSITRINGQTYTPGTQITLQDGDLVYGYLTVEQDGSFTFTPSLRYKGPVTFSYTISDGEYESTAWVTINVFNNAPFLSDQEFSILHDQDLVGNLLSSAYDPDGDAIRITHVNGQEITYGQPISLLSGGSLTIFADGTFSYTPPPNFVGTDSFSLTISDDLDSYTAMVNIQATNTAPYAYDASFSVLHDRELTGQVYGYDPDGDLVVAELVSEPERGSLEINSDGSFTYMPSTDFNGIDSFSFIFFDGLCRSNIAKVWLVGHDWNPLPSIGSVEVEEGQAVEFGVGSLWLEPENGIVYEASGLPPGLAINPQTGLVHGVVSYDAVQENAHEQSYTVTLSTTWNNFEYSREFTILVRSNSPLHPIARSDIYELPANIPLTVSDDQGLLRNDWVHESQIPLTLVDFNPLNGGLWQVQASGAFEFAPDADSEEIFIATYTVVTPSGFANSASVFIGRPAPDPFVALKPLYNRFIQYVGNKITHHWARIKLGELIEQQVTSHPTLSGRIVISQGEVYLRSLGVGPRHIDAVKDEFAKDNKIPVADVEIILAVHFCYDPVKKSADALVAVVLRDKLRRVAPTNIGSTGVLNLPCRTEPAHIPAGGNHHDFGEVLPPP